MMALGEWEVGPLSRFWSSLLHRRLVANVLLVQHPCKVISAGMLYFVVFVVLLVVL